MKLVNNIFHDNTGDRGISVVHSRGEIRNNTIVQNNFVPVVIADDSNLRNNIVSFNQIPGGYGAINVVGKPSDLQASGNNLFNNKNAGSEALSSTGVTPPLTGSADPQFSNLSLRDLTLKKTSPCYGTGTDGSDRFGTTLSGMNIGASFGEASIPFDFSELLSDANSHLRMRRLSEAVAAFKLILEVYPLNHDALNGMSATLIADGKPAEAIEICRRVLKTQPENSIAYFMKGCAHALMNQGEQALSSLDSAFRYGFQPDDAENDERLQSISNTDAFKKLLLKYKQ
jgi:tetratricopeptide (TPR) repeat protein